MKTRLRILMLMSLTFAVVNPLCAQWVQARGPYDDPSSTLAVDSNSIYVVYYIGDGVRSTDGGASWQAISQVFPIIGFVNSLTTKGADLYAGTASGIYLTANSGRSWTAIDSGLPSSVYVKTIVVSPDSTGDLLAGTNHGVFHSTNNGLDWTPVNAGLTDTNVHCLLFNGSELFAGTDSGLFASSDNGLNWVWSGSGPRHNSIPCLASYGKDLYAGTDSGVFVSTDAGNDWIADGLSGEFIRALAFKDSTLFAGTDDGLFFTGDHSSDWNDGHLPTGIFFIVMDGSNILASSSGGIFLSTDNALSWKCLTGQTVDVQSTLARRGTKLFAATQNGAFLSTDNGESWLPAGLWEYSVRTLAFEDSSVFALANGRLYLSTNSGSSWSTVTLPTKSTLNGFYLNLMMTDRDSLFIATVGDSIFASGDNGENWKFQGSGPSTGTLWRLLADPDSSNILYGWTSAMVKSSDYGASWTVIDSGLTDSTVNDLAFCDKALYAATTDGVFLTTNMGRSWTAASNTFVYPYVRALAADSTLPDRLFAGTQNGDVYMTANSGSTWVNVGQGFPDRDVYGLAVCGTNLVAGTNGSTVWYRPLSQIITGVSRASSNNPSDFRLFQNYPNPFNPSTVIRYQLSRVSHVTLTIYDVLGREVETLVNQRQNAGNYSVKLNGADLPSGVYFYRLEAGTYHDTMKLLLLK